MVQLLWEGERDELALTEKQTFIDLGCGNGLLVYLLSSEGVYYTHVHVCNTQHTVHVYSGPVLVVHSSVYINIMPSN